MNTGHAPGDVLHAEDYGAAKPDAGQLPGDPSGDAMLARRMRRQAAIMAFVALSVLAITFAVPFVLRYFQIVIP